MAGPHHLSDADERRVLAEYREMRYLRLTAAQASRLFGIDPQRCALLLDTLVQRRYLTRDRNGHYVLPPDISTHI